VLWRTRSKSKVNISFRKTNPAEPAFRITSALAEASDRLPRAGRVVTWQERL